MVEKSQFRAFLDIGTSRTRALVCKVEHGASGVDAALRPATDVLAYAETPSQGLRKGVVINIDATTSAIRDVIERVQSDSGLKLREVTASVSGAHVQGLNSVGISGIRQGEVSSDDISRAIESACAVAIPADREFLHILPQEFVVDAQEGIRSPLGISGVRLEARVHLVTGSVNAAQNVVKCINRCGLVVRDLVISGLAASSSVLTEEERELGVCLLDIGAGTTDILVIKQNSVVHSSVVAIAGTHITNDIAAGLRTPIAASEIIKTTYASACRVQAAEFHESIEVASTGGREPRIVSRSALAEIVEPRVREIFEIVSEKLLTSDMLDCIASGFVITGGSSRLSGIASLAETVLEMPVRIASPRVEKFPHSPQYTSSLTSPAAAVVTGLMLHQVSDESDLPTARSNRGSGDGMWQRVSRFVSQYL